MTSRQKIILVIAAAAPILVAAWLFGFLSPTPDPVAEARAAAAACLTGKSQCLEVTAGPARWSTPPLSAADRCARPEAFEIHPPPPEPGNYVRVGLRCRSDEGATFLVTVDVTRTMTGVDLQAAFARCLPQGDCATAASWGP